MSLPSTLKTLSAFKFLNGNLDWGVFGRVVPRSEIRQGDYISSCKTTLRGCLLSQDLKILQAVTNGQLTEFIAFTAPLSCPKPLKPLTDSGGAPGFWPRHSTGPQSVHTPQAFYQRPPGPLVGFGIRLPAVEYWGVAFCRKKPEALW